MYDRRSSHPTAKKVVKFDIKGLMAPVFTFFKEDQEFTLELDYVNTYAQWLKNRGIRSILVNGITGEGPALGVNERKRNAEAWVHAARNHHLSVIVEVGGAPLPDVLELAIQAEELGVDGVSCLPELFYKPKNTEQLVGYCNIVAKKCSTRPFLYSHIPKFTKVLFDMLPMCEQAEECTPNFVGILYFSLDLENGAKCLRDGRSVFLGESILLASGMMLGYECGLCAFLNMIPELGFDIYNAMQSSNLAIAKQKQRQLNNILRFYTSHSTLEGVVGAMKTWFNDVHSRPGGANFSAGPSRKFY